MLGMFTLIISAGMIVWLNPSVIGVGSFALGKSGEPLLDGFRAIYGGERGEDPRLRRGDRSDRELPHHHLRQGPANLLAVASRLFPDALSVTHGGYKTPHVAMIVGALVALAVMFVVWFGVGSEKGSAIIGGTLLNMAVFGAMFSYILQAISFIMLRRNLPNIERPYRSPLGIPGAVVTIIIGLVTVYYQLSDPVYRVGVIAVACWFVVGIIYFALFARHRMILSPEEEFAMEHKKKS